ncbi:MAG TPA: SRPBCC family protein [Pseudonocardiaceae bacterium]
MSVTFEVRVPVAAPAELVWAAITDWPAQGEWMPGTVVVVADGDGRTVGTRLFAFTGLADVGFLDVLEIVDWQPPHRCRMRHLGRLLHGYGEFTVEAGGDGGSTFVWTEVLRPPLGPLGHLALLLLRAPSEALMRRGGRALAAMCVRRAADSGQSQTRR